jgi:hypothetical protein
MLEGDAGPRNLFPLGAIHLVDVAVMAAALVFALAMARRAGTRSSPVSG